jgi:hypothetical protein
MKKIFTAACWIARWDETLIRDNRDRQTVVFRAALLLLVAIFAAVAWTAFWAQFLGFWGLPLGLLFAGFIFLLDQAIGASEQNLTGFLRE